MWCYKKICFVFSVLLLCHFVDSVKQNKIKGGNKHKLKFLKNNRGIGNNVRRNTNSSNVGLWPSVFNLATKAVISANATCGTNEREEFCRLSENGKGRCGICDDYSPDKRHAINFAIDGSNRWWQSPSLHYGPEYEYVTITVDLKQVKITHIYPYGLLQMCTGSLLTTLHVLTAAHCCKYPDQVAIAGDNGPDRALRLVMTMYKHPNYKIIEKKPRDDVCIMLLESSVKLSRYISKVRLPSKAMDVQDFSKLYENKQGLILGWGFPHEPDEGEEENADFPDELLCTKVPIIGYTKCKSLYPQADLKPTTMCTLEEKKGICFGDSGGPVMNENNVQIGISSWGIGCGRKDNPDVYERTDQFLDYMEQFLQRARIAEDTANFNNKLNVWIFGVAVIGQFFNYILFL